MMKIIIIVAAVVVVSIAGAVVWFMNSGPDLRQYESLKDPKISVKPGQKMIQAELRGDPSVTGGKAIGRLYGVFYSLKNNGIRQAAPRARWPVSQDAAREDWVGIFGLPVSDTVTELPPAKDGVPVELAVWEYGTVAEILHIGPYSTEQSTVDRLKTFIGESGYEISGSHEEEYLKGPGMFPTDPNSYHTIIRYPIKKK